MDDWAAKRLAELRARAPKKRKADKTKKFAYVPLPWGYRALTAAGRGAAIVAHVLHVQKTTGHGDVPITAAFLKQCGLNYKVRNNTIADLVAGRFATAHRRGSKHQGCALLTMLPPGPGDKNGNQ